MSLSDRTGLRIDLDDRIAVFLNLIPNSLIVDLKDNSGVASPGRFIPVGVSMFAATGSVLRVRSTKRISSVQYWLLSKDVCPDVHNIGFLSADRMLHIETGINGTTCLFAGTDTKNEHSIAIETDYGFPDIAFYHPKGKGKPVRHCIGESDICEFKTQWPFMVSFKGNTSVRMKYEIESNNTGVACAVQGIPQFRNKNFQLEPPKLTKIYNTICTKREDKIRDALKGMIMMVIFTIIVSIGIVKSSFICIQFGKHTPCQILGDAYNDCL